MKRPAPSAAEKILRAGKTRKWAKNLFRYLFLTFAAFLMIYPLIWMIGASFSEEILPGVSFLPQQVSLLGWTEAFRLPGWGSSGGYSFFRAVWNTLQYVLPHVVFMTFSCLLVAFVIARFRFRGRKLVFALVIGTLLMPAAIFRIPLYRFWTEGPLAALWVDTDLPFLGFLPLWAGSLFAANSFSIFMYVQFMRTIPRDLDEAAYIDGAGRFQVLRYVLLPVLKPIVITVALLLFLAAYNDYQGPLIYVTRPDRLPLAIILKIFGKDSTNTYAHIFARSILTVSVPVLLFFVAQKYFLGNDTESAVKG